MDDLFDDKKKYFCKSVGSAENMILHFQQIFRPVFITSCRPNNACFVVIVLHIFEAQFQQLFTRAPVQASQIFHPISNRVALFIGQKKRDISYNDVCEL